MDDYPGLYPSPLRETSYAMKRCSTDAVVTAYEKQRARALEILGKVIKLDSSLPHQFLRLWNHKKLYWKPLPKSLVKAWMSFCWPKDSNSDHKIIVEKALLIQSSLDKKEESGLPIKANDLNEWASLSKKAHSVMASME